MSLKNSYKWCTMKKNMKKAVNSDLVGETITDTKEWDQGLYGGVAKNYAAVWELMGSYQTIAD